MAKPYIRIKDRPEEERPRERMERIGAAQLSDAELLAILITTGTKDTSAIDLGHQVLALASGNWHELAKLSFEEFEKIAGIGRAKSITISAALEIGKRRQYAAAIHRPVISDSRKAADIIIPAIGDLNHEAFCVLYINQANRMIKRELISTGGITGTVADIRIILRNALLYRATQLIVGHNHPSGNINPSTADKKLTEKLKASAAHMDIILLDHLIISNEGAYFSMNDAGIM